MLGNSILSHLFSASIGLSGRSICVSNSAAQFAVKEEQVNHPCRVMQDC